MKRTVLVLDVTVVKSSSNSELKLCRRLGTDAAVRAEHGLFVIDGSRIVFDIFKSHKPYLLICSATYFQREEKRLQSISSAQKVRVYTVSDRLFKTISFVQHPEGIAGIFHKMDQAVPKFDVQKELFVVGCENIQDPLNLGVIIRSCRCFSVVELLLINASVDPYHPKVLRASAGFSACIPINAVSYGYLDHMRSHGYRLYGSVVPGVASRAVQDCECTHKKKVLLFGNEGSGLSSPLIEKCDTLFHIPINNKTDSLNVSSAVAISLFYFSLKGITT